MPDIFNIRLIKETDVDAVLEIYRPYVLDTIVSFEYEVPTFGEFAERIRTITAEYPWLVCLEHDNIIGYSYACRFRQRAAYQWSPESAIYMAQANHRKGIGRILYRTLFSMLRLQGYFNVYAGISLPGDKSVAFHRAIGFEEIGDFKKIGYKHGDWHDTKWFQYFLSEHIDNPPSPKKIKEIEHSEEVKSIFRLANEQLANMGSGD